MVIRKILLVNIFLLLVTFAAFWQVSFCDFINFDDALYVINNSHIQGGLTTDGIRWAFTTGYAANWHPLTWLSHMLDVQLFGMKPGWHHLTNLLFHIANALLLFFVLHRMTKAIWQSAFVAALFALHPLHVESVAWVAERKDVLSTFFWLLTMGAYCYHVERPGARRYFFVLLFFSLGLMAKAMLVTLPFVLLLLDHWPLRRFEGKKPDWLIQIDARNAAPPDGRRQKSKEKTSSGLRNERVQSERSSDWGIFWAWIHPLLRQKVPLFFLSAIACFVTYHVQLTGGAVQTAPLGERISNIFISYVAYIWKMFWPKNLAIYYPYPSELPIWKVLGAVLILIAITVMVICAARRLTCLAVGWFWYVGTLVPVIGLVQVGGQARADRYTYIPLIGLFIMAAWGIPALLEKWHYRRQVLIALSTLTLSILFILTWTQVGYWENDFALYDHALQVTEKNDVIFYNRGAAHAAIGKNREAILDYTRAIEINPNHIQAYINRGNVYQALGNYPQAIQDYDRAIEIDSKMANTFYNRGIAYTNRGIVYQILGNYPQSILDHNKSIEINPTYPKSYINRGIVYKALGNYPQAILDYNRAIEIDPKMASAYFNRGNLYAAIGNYPQAILDYNKALEINPDYAKAYYNRAVANSHLGNQEKKFEDLKAAALLGEKAAQNILKNQGMNLKMEQ